MSAELAPLPSVSETVKTVRVWDILLRVFHWSLVSAFAIAYLFEAGTTLHFAAGYTVAGLLVFRLLWGLVGSKHARFANFVKGPTTTLRYLRDIGQRRAARTLGHNPAGAAMIIALIVMLALTAGSGILMTQDAWWGYQPLEDFHKIIASVTVGLIGLHVLGVIIASLEHRENLVLAMITGRKRESIQHKER
jgi:cytochrome b